MRSIFYLMGKSSSGKDTIYKELRKRMPELKPVTLYTTRPIREGECDGVEYFFVDEKRLEMLQKEKKVIEVRAYDTIHGIWKYFTADDGQFSGEEQSYLMIGTLESYHKMKEYFGEEVMVPLYIEVEDGVRLRRALEREEQQKEPKYAELCRRFLADSEDFSEENLLKEGIKERFENNNIEEVLMQLCERIKGNP